MKEVKGVFLPDDDTYFSFVLEKEGDWEQEKIQEAMALCGVRRHAVDVGAHVGLYTRRMVGVFERVTAFEPNYDNFQCLKKNAPRAEAFNVALSDGAGLGKMMLDEKEKGNSGSWYVGNEVGGNVSMAALDSFKLLNIDFLKVDVEGAEWHVLKGAMETLQMCRPVILLEVKSNLAKRYGVEDWALQLAMSLGWRVKTQIKNDYILVS